MENKNKLYSLLQTLKDGKISIDSVLEELERDSTVTPLYSEHVGVGSFGRVDHDRQKRRGFPEVICGVGKTSEQISEIFFSLSRQNDIVLCTRAKEEDFKATKKKVPDCCYDPISKALFLKRKEIQNRGRGMICIVAAGTSDLPVAEEAFITATLMGNEVKKNH